MALYLSEHAPLLPGAKRLMDEFEVVSEPGRGTTITMKKWIRRGHA